MTFLRVLPAVLLLWLNLALAQQKPDSEQATADRFSLFQDRPSFPFQDKAVVSPATGSAPQPLPKNYQFDITQDGQLAMYATCFTMRSYVVARDAKKSDSTHFVRYSTCQPANQYRLKSADIQGNDPQQLRLK